MLASCASDGTVRLWQIESRQVITNVQLSKPKDDFQGRILFSPDGKHLVSGGRDGSVRYWDPVEKPATPPHAVLPVPVWCPAFAFSPDGQRLISGGADPTDVVRLMDLGSKRYVATLPGEPDEVWFLETTPDGSTLVAVGMNATALLWRAPA